MKNIQPRVVRRVSVGLVLTLIAVTLIWWLRSPRSGQGLSPVGALIPPGAWYAYTTDYPTGYDCNGFDFFSRFEYTHVFDRGRKEHSHEYRGQRYNFHFDARTNEYKVTTPGNTPIVFRMDELLTSLKNGGHHRTPASPFALNQKNLTLEKTIGQLRARMYIEDLTALENDKKWQVHHLQAVVLVEPDYMPASRRGENKSSKKSARATHRPGFNTQSNKQSKNQSL